MVTRMSKGVSSFFITQGIIPVEDREIYDYSFEVLISTVLSFLALFVFALLSKTLFYALFFLAGFMPLRLVAGGYHAKSHSRCFLILMGIYALLLLAIYILTFFSMIIVIAMIVIVSVLMVFLFAPSEDKNNPVSTENKNKYKKKSRLFIVFYATFIFSLLVIVPDKSIAFSIAAGVLSVSISLLANFIKYRKQIK